MRRERERGKKNGVSGCESECVRWWRRQRSGRTEGADEGWESEEEMDGGRGRDVRKLRVQEVFYGAIGKEPKEQKERDGGGEKKRFCKGGIKKIGQTSTCGTKEGMRKNEED